MPRRSAASKTCRPSWKRSPLEGAISWPRYGAPPGSPDFHDGDTKPPIAARSSIVMPPPRRATSSTSFRAKGPV